MRVFSIGTIINVLPSSWKNYSIAGSKFPLKPLQIRAGVAAFEANLED